MVNVHEFSTKSSPPSADKPFSAFCAQAVPPIEVGLWEPAKVQIQKAIPE